MTAQFRAMPHPRAPSEAERRVRQQRNLLWMHAVFCLCWSGSAYSRWRDGDEWPWAWLVLAAGYAGLVVLGWRGYRRSRRKLDVDVDVDVDVDDRAAP